MPTLQLLHAALPSFLQPFNFQAVSSDSYLAMFIHCMVQKGAETIRTLCWIPFLPINFFNISFDHLRKVSYMHQATPVRLRLAPLIGEICTEQKDLIVTDLHAFSYFVGAK